MSGTFLLYGKISVAEIYLKNIAKQIFCIICFLWQDWVDGKSLILGQPTCTCGVDGRQLLRVLGGW